MEVERFQQLTEFLSSCSDRSLGELQLNRLNQSSNHQKEFQDAAKKLLELAQKLVEVADSWAQFEAEARYVTFIREASKLARETQVIEAKRIVEKRRKRLPREVA
jgi:hypothetical protein